MHTWSSSVDECASYTVGLEELRSNIEGLIEKLDDFGGYCPGCKRVTRFSHRRPPNGEWSDLRENIVCDCGLNGRMRMILDIVRGPLQTSDGVCVIFERNTPLFEFLRQIKPDLIGTEFFLGSDRVGGQYYKIGELLVRHEDMMALSFPSDSVALLVHGDVLEHVPDPKRALSECFRILKPGGVMYLTTPFFFRKDHVVRARVEQGVIKHYADEVYHGNPVSSDGSLVFTEFGEPLMDDISQAGFREVTIGILYDPLKGILSNNNPYQYGLMWPVIFKAYK